MSGFRAAPGSPGDGEVLSESRLRPIHSAIVEVQKSPQTKSFEAQLQAQGRKFQWDHSQQATYRGVQGFAVIVPVVTNAGAPTESFYLHSGQPGTKEIGVMIVFKPPLRLNVHDASGRGLDFSFNETFLLTDARDFMATARVGGPTPPVVKMNWSCFLSCLRDNWGSVPNSWIMKWCKKKCVNCLQNPNWGVCLVCATCVAGSILWCWYHCQ